jgi:hypothetical protein
MSQAILDRPREEVAEAADVPSVEAVLARQRRKQRWSRFLKIVRRSHLYAGLFMTPWVFLYGITAFLFNHPSILSDQTAVPLKGQAAAAVFDAMVPNAAKVAADTVAAINQRTGSQYRVDDSVAPKFTRPLTLAMTDGQSTYQVSYDLEARSGSVRVAPIRAANPPASADRSPLPSRIPFDGFDLSRSVAEMTPLLKQAGLPTDGLKSADDGGEARGRESSGDSGVPRKERSPGRAGEPGQTNRPAGRGRAARSTPDARGVSPESPATAAPPMQGRGLPQGPEVAFVMKDDARVWQVTYNLRTGALSGRGEGDAGSPSAGQNLSTRRYFLRLHTAHGYPNQLNARWAWAVIVDVMFVCMVGWAVTGLVMWHQMKHLRRIGWFVLAASLAASVLMAIGMHGEMVAAGR